MNKLQSFSLAAAVSLAGCGQPLEKSDVQAHQKAEEAAMKAESQQNIESILTACSTRKEQCLSTANGGLAEAAKNKALEEIACKRSSMPGCDAASKFVYNQSAKEWSMGTLACTENYTACLEKSGQ